MMALGPAARDEMNTQLRELAQLRNRVELMAPHGRERALALTKLDEAGHWLADAWQRETGAGR